MASFRIYMKHVSYVVANAATNTVTNTIQESNTTRFNGNNSIIVPPPNPKLLYIPYEVYVRNPLPAEPHTYAGFLAIAHPSRYFSHRLRYYEAGFERPVE